MSNRSVSNEPIASNAKRCCGLASCAILAAGIGFGIRGGILANWALTSGSPERSWAPSAAPASPAFVSASSSVVSSWTRSGMASWSSRPSCSTCSRPSSRLRRPRTASQATAYLFLYLGTFVFALANGTLEAVANPLVSTLFPNNRTHYLNILHASWPAGLVLGGLVGWILGEGMQVGWKLQLGLFLVPTVLYGIAFFGQHFPKSEASAKGLSVGQMLQEVGILGALVACLLIGLFFKEQLGGILVFFTGNPFFASAAWSTIAWALPGSCC